MASVRAFSALVKGFARALNPLGLFQPTKPSLRSVFRPIVAAVESRPQHAAAFARSFASQRAATGVRTRATSCCGRRAARLPLYGFVVGLAYYGNEQESTDEPCDVKAVAASLLQLYQKQESRFDDLGGECGAAAVRSLKDVELHELLGWGCSGGVFAASITRDVPVGSGVPIAHIADRWYNDRSSSTVSSDAAEPIDGAQLPPPPTTSFRRVADLGGGQRAIGAQSDSSSSICAAAIDTPAMAVGNVADQTSCVIDLVAKRMVEWPENSGVEHDCILTDVQNEQRCEVEIAPVDSHDMSYAAIAPSESFEVLDPLSSDAEVVHPLDASGVSMAESRSPLYEEAEKEYSAAVDTAASSFSILSNSLALMSSCAANSHLYTDALGVRSGNVPSVQKSWLAIEDTCEDTSEELSFEVVPDHAYGVYGLQSAVCQSGFAKHVQRSFVTTPVATATAVGDAQLPELLLATSPGSCAENSNAARRERRANVSSHGEAASPSLEVPQASGIAFGPNLGLTVPTTTAARGRTNCQVGTASRQGCQASPTSIIAIKIMFNTPRALKAIGEELLPLAAGTGSFGFRTPLLRDTCRHPNIVEMYLPFVDVIPDQLLCRLGRQSVLMVSSPSGGLPATVFVPMKRYACTLYSYIRQPGGDTSTTPVCTAAQVHARLACQLFEGVAFLESVGVAHRDLKSENILLEPCGCSHDAATDAQRSYQCCSPKLVISDFGHALVGLRLPYERPEVSLGGNPAHRPPEIRRALASPGAVVDYSKSDAWAAGLIALEILTGGASRDRHLKHHERVGWLRQQLLRHQRGANVNRRSHGGSGSDGLHRELCRVVASLLESDPILRPSASDAANAIQLCLWLNDSLVEMALHPFAAAESLLAMTVGCIFSSSPRRCESELRRCGDYRPLGRPKMCHTDLKLQLTFLERVDADSVRSAACRLVCAYQQ